MEYRSALLASHGYVSLALDYMTPKTSGNGTQHVGNDYFEVIVSTLPIWLLSVYTCIVAQTLCRCYHVIIVLDQP